MTSKENNTKENYNFDYEEKKEEEEEEELDPRIKCELEKLNAATDGINHVETEFGEAQALFQQTMQDASSQLKAMHQKLGKSVDKSRPYYEALKCAQFSHSELHEAALKFEQAQTRHFNAKKLVSDTEKIVFSSTDRKLDPALQEMLNQATVEVMEAATQAQKAWEIHRNASVEFEKKNKVALDLYSSLKKHIVKSGPYFELKRNFNQQLELQKSRLEKVKEGIQHSKNEYAKILHNLELISDNIHHSREMRQKNFSETRGEGVGSESKVEKNSTDLVNESVKPEYGGKSSSETSSVCNGSCDFSVNNDKSIDDASLINSPNELLKVRMQVKSLLETSAEQKSKNRLSQIELRIDVNKTISENCFDKSYDVITSHSIPFAPPHNEYVDSSLQESHNISDHSKSSIGYSEHETVSRRHTFSGEIIDSFSIVNGIKKLHYKSQSSLL